MQIRSPGQPASNPAPPPDQVSFRVPTAVPVAKLVLAAVVAVAALITGDRLALWVGVLVALGLAVSAVRDQLTRDRLTADRTGLRVVAGFAGRRELSWDEVETLRIDERLRLGVRTRLLEVDADAELYQFGRYDLGVEPTEALDLLSALRPSRPA